MLVSLLYFCILRGASIVPVIRSAWTVTLTHPGVWIDTTDHRFRAIHGIQVCQPLSAGSVAFRDAILPVNKTTRKRLETAEVCHAQDLPLLPVLTAGQSRQHAQSIHVCSERWGFATVRRPSSFS